MKGKQLAILLALVVILGAAGYIVIKGNQSAWSSSGGGAGRKVLDFPINDVTRVRVAASGADLNLVKKSDEWTVQERADYPANFEQVSGLLRKLWDLKTVQDVKVGPSQMSRLELVEPGKGDHSGTLIEFKDKDDKVLSALLLGKNYVKKSDASTMGMPDFPTGRYVTPVGSGKVSLVSDTLSEAEPKPESWLRKDFIKIEQPKSISVIGQTDAMRWALNRESATAEWKLADAKPEEQLDTAKVSSFATLFSNPSFKDVLAPDAKPEETGLDKPTTVTVETFDNFTYKLTIGKLTNDAYPVLVNVSANLAKERTPGKDEKPEDKTRLDEEFKNKQQTLETKLAAEKKFEGRPYLLEKQTIEPLLKERTALLAETKPDTTTTSTSPVPGGTPATAATAPVSVTTPPVSVTTPPVTVTTPPVSVSSVVTPPITAPVPEAAAPQPSPAPAPVPATPPAPPAPAAPTEPAAPQAQPASNPAPANPSPAPAPAPPASIPEAAPAPAQPAPAPEAAPASAPAQATPAPVPAPAPTPSASEPAPPAPAPSAAPSPAPEASPAPASAQPAPEATPTPASAQPASSVAEPPKVENTSSQPATPAPEKPAGDQQP